MRSLSCEPSPRNLMATASARLASASSAPQPDDSRRTPERLRGPVWSRPCRVLHRRCSPASPSRQPRRPLRLGSQYVRQLTTWRRIQFQALAGAHRLATGQRKCVWRCNKPSPVAQWSWQHSSWWRMARWMRRLMPTAENGFMASWATRP
jgi:hypothetical protein